MHAEQHHQAAAGLDGVRDEHDFALGQRIGERADETAAGRQVVAAGAALAAPVPGDLLVSSSRPGYAMRAGKETAAGTVIGKALEKLDKNKEDGVIEVVVMLR